VPDITESGFHQWAVYWPFSGWDRWGQPTVGPPQQVPVSQWVTKRTKAVDPKLGTITLDATSRCYKPLKVDSHIWLGTLEEWYGTAGTGSGSGSTAVDDELMVIRTYTETPDVKGRFSEKTIGMQRLHQSSGD